MSARLRLTGPSCALAAVAAIVSSLLAGVADALPVQAAPPASPHVGPKTKLAYVTTHEDGTVWVVNARTNAVVTTISLPKDGLSGITNELVASPDGSRV